MPSLRALPRSRRTSRPQPRPSYAYSEQHFSQPNYRNRRSDWQGELDADLAAMNKVWKMLRHGAVRMLGEIGRQY